MALPFLGEIKIFAGNFSPRGYALCNGQLLAISQNTALFSILGTTYGGNGTSTFALPNFQNNIPVHVGQGAGLSNYVLGQSGGEGAHTLTTAELPAHNHALHGAAAAATGDPATVAGMELLAQTAVATKIYHAPTNLLPMADGLSASAGGAAHENRQPQLGLTFLIVLEGVFPSRN